jgi:RNA polymerase sigma-70 factor (ECF subfamily)
MTSRQPECDPLVALRAGDPAPFETLVHERTRTLTAYFRHQGAAPGQAEDLTQEVFLRLYRNAARYEPRERFAAYLFRVARNVWIDDCRRYAVRIPAAPEEFAARADEPTCPAPDPGMRVLLDEEEHGLRGLLAELPSGHRRVFELVLLGELSYAEVSAQLEIPVGTVKSRMFHAVRRLRVLWLERRQREEVASA